MRIAAFIFATGTFVNLTQAQVMTAQEIQRSSRCQSVRTESLSGGGERTLRTSCGDERVMGVDDRLRPTIIQPQGPPGLKAACGSEIPTRMSFQAVVHELQCGEGAVAHDRVQTPVSKKVMDEWGRMSRTSLPNKQARMQEIRRAEVRFDGEIEYPTYESWTYQELIGNFDARCGYEDWITTCEVERVQEVTDVTYRQVCAEYEVIEDEPSSSSPVDFGAGSSSKPPRDSYRPDRGNVDTSLPKKPKGKGESSDEIREDRRRRFEGGSLILNDLTRRPAGTRQGKCLRWERRREVDTRRSVVGRVNYSCLKQRPRYCTWLEPRTVTQRCENQKARYSVTYAHDSKWKPGYEDSKFKHRNYQDILPNKFDLLSGETEVVTVFNNYGESRGRQTPRVQIRSEWNEYRAETQPSTLACQLKKDTEFHVTVHTIGRNRVRAPNPLALPVDANGREVFPLEIQDGRPVRVRLLDKGRATQMRAAELSRMFAKPENSAKAERDVVHKRAEVSSSLVRGLVGDAYWHETQFRMQLFQKGRWGTIYNLTVPSHFGSNQGILQDSEMSLSLTGQDSIPNFYRAKGPFQRLLGWVWERAGVEFTPGEVYYFRIQALPQGLPFYENGCPDGQATCEGEEANEKAFSAPLDFQWQAPRDLDNRSLLKRLIDFQKKFQIL
ncbi:MAG: hypothetical protein ACK5Y2_08325 [Bdellovibrionales bacterium]